nr:MAG TPA: hypothetical protein [Caudoviricetes sp.]
MLLFAFIQKFHEYCISSVHKKRILTVVLI